LLKLRPLSRRSGLSGIRVEIAVGIQTESRLAVSSLFGAVEQLPLVVFALFWNSRGRILRSFGASQRLSAPEVDKASGVATKWAPSAAVSSGACRNLLI
jgi:hypothetical protein